MPNLFIFTQDVLIDVPFKEDHRNIRIKNAHIGKVRHFLADHVITSIPENDWQLYLSEGIRIDMIPVDKRVMR